MKFRITFERQFIDDQQERTVIVVVNGRQMGRYPVTMEMLEQEQGMTICIPLPVVTKDPSYVKTAKIEVLVE